MNSLDLAKKAKNDVLQYRDNCIKECLCCGLVDKEMIDFFNILLLDESDCIQKIHSLVSDGKFVLIIDPAMMTEENAFIHETAIPSFYDAATSGDCEDHVFSTNLDILIEYNEYVKKLKKQKLEDDVFIGQAIKMSKLSKCVSKQVCALIVKDGRVISTGINGSRPGGKNCCDKFGDDFDPDEHHRWSNVHETHAEMMAILKCSESTQGTTLYCTLQPCSECTKIMPIVGINRVVYLNEYERTPQDVKDIFEEANIEYVRYER